MGEQERYLRLLSREYPTVQAAVSEIFHLRAQQKLPKGTEYFFSDLHGEYAGFLRLLKSASGTIGDKIRTTFEGELDESEQNQLANLIYDPEEVLSVLERYRDDLCRWKQDTIYRLIRLNRVMAGKYTRQGVRERLPKAYASAIDELLHEDDDNPDKQLYYEEMIRTIFDTGAEDAFIAALCHLARELGIAKLHIIGDIFDRGPRADIIMDELMRSRDVDIQWGNHDIS